MHQLACPTGNGTPCWTCDDCLVSWTDETSQRSSTAGRSQQKLAMTHHTPFTARRAIYDDALQVRIDAAIARTRRFIIASDAIRATAKRPFVPFCLSCQQEGHLHDSPPTGEQHYICPHCHRRWVAQPSAS